jgi:hypothetical protein
MKNFNQLPPQKHEKAKIPDALADLAKKLTRSVVLFITKFMGG